MVTSPSCALICEKSIMEEVATEQSSYLPSWWSWVWQRRPERGPENIRPKDIPSDLLPFLKFPACFQIAPSRRQPTTRQQAFPFQTIILLLPWSSFLLQLFLRVWILSGLTLVSLPLPWLSYSQEFLVLWHLHDPTWHRSPLCLTELTPTS